MTAAPGTHAEVWNRFMRIHQITDLHVPEDDSSADFDHVKPNILRQLAFVAADDSDLLVVSGDLTMKDASRSGCEWLESVLPATPRTIVMPGNHDDPEVLWEVFGAAKCVDEHFFFGIRCGHWNFLFLNTTTDSLPEEQLEFLAAQPAGVRAILFVHHPPDLVSDGYMASNQPLLNHARAGEAIGASSIEHVFCGHYHNAMDKTCDGFELHLTPSPAFQIDLHSIPFKMESFEPAVRVIEVGDDSVETRLVSV